MKIILDGKKYTLYVEECYMDENKNIQRETIPLDEWAEIVRKKAISSLYYIEEQLSGFFKREIKLSNDYPEIKRPIMNLSGSVQRLPNNLFIKEENSFVEFGETKEG